MKIWFPVIRGYSGTDVFTERLSRALERRGLAAPITWLPSHFQWLPHLLRWVRTPRSTSVVHANAWHGVGCRRPMPLVLTEHQGTFGRAHRRYRNLAQEFVHTQIMRRYLAQSLAAADATVAVSEYVSRQLATTVGQAATDVIPNFVDTDRFAPSMAPPRPGPFRLLFIGNFTALKGALLLAPLMERLGPHFELRFTTGVRHLSLPATPDNMHCLGRITSEPALIEAYRSCDAVLVPSLFEGFGYVALEAMACGKPVVASRAAALPEVVRDQVSGLLCAPGDVSQFEQAVRRLAENPAHARALGDQGRAIAVQHFAESVVVPQYIDVYERVLDA